MRSPASPRIAVVGGGFTGAAFALYLLQKGGTAAASLEVFEPKATLGAGLAYSAEDSEHRINIAAARMAVFPDDPTHFDRWLHQTGEIAADPKALVSLDRAYPRRAAFARYVDGLVRHAAQPSGMIEFRHTRSRVDRIVPAGDGYRLELDNGEIRQADLVALAVGHPPPALPAPLRPVIGHRRLIRDPWSAAALQSVRAEDRVLIVGTGLTMGDVVASLRARGHIGAVTAVSRRGLTPRPRTTQPVEAIGDFGREPSRTVLGLLRRVRATLRDARDRGRPWEDVIDALRVQGTAIWRALPAVERRRFLRHLRPYWDVHRYQAAPQIDELLTAERREGKLNVLAASLVSVRAQGEGFLVELRRRGSRAGTIHEPFDVIVNCTGPAHDTVVASNPALSSLAEAGLLRPDDFGLGIDVDSESRVLDADGNPNDTLLVVGPLARSAFGELMGLPQVSLQAESVAARVTGWITRQERSERPVEQTRIGLSA